MFKIRDSCPRSPTSPLPSNFPVFNCVLLKQSWHRGITPLSVTSVSDTDRIDVYISVYYIYCWYCINFEALTFLYDAVNVFIYGLDDAVGSKNFKHSAECVQSL